MKPFLQRELLDPLCLKWAYNLNDEELAGYLGLQPRVIRYYSAGKRSPSVQVKMLAAYIHRDFQENNVSPVNPSALRFETL